MNKQAAQKEADRIVAAFDFKAVQDHMKAVGWKYFDSPEVPTLERLEDMLRENIRTAIFGASPDDAHRSVSSGGFEVRIDKWSTAGPYRISLNFVLSRMSGSFYDEEESK